jgi:hypothetical protein
MTPCRGCGETRLTRVLDLGNVPAADSFPLATERVRPNEASHPLAMDTCLACGLAQLAEDDTITDEPRGVEPQALKDQAAAAVDLVAESGWLRGDTVLEFGSPHGGTWIPLLTARGYREVDSRADVVLDCFGIMHEPDQQAAFARRAKVMDARGVLLLQFHPITTIIERGQWNALRHGHFAYYSMTSMRRLLADVGMSVAAAWEFDLYGGTLLLAVVQDSVEPSATVRRILAAEHALNVGDPTTLRTLQRTADQQVDSLRSWLEQEVEAGHVVLAYGAASRAVALFSRAGLDSRLIQAVADASPAKQGRRMPATDIPIVSPDQLLAANPDRVLLTLPDLLPEISEQYPQLNGRWTVDVR